MRTLKAFVGAVLGAVPGIALTPILQFYGLVVIVGGALGGAMVGLAPEGRMTVTAIGALIGLAAGAGLGLVAGPLALLLAPAGAFIGARLGATGMGSGPPEILQH